MPTPHFSVVRSFSTFVVNAVIEVARGSTGARAGVYISVLDSSFLARRRSKVAILEHRGADEVPRDLHAFVLLAYLRRPLDAVHVDAKLPPTV